MRQLFLERRPPSETDKFRELVAELHSRGRTRHPPCRSEAEILDYFRSLRSLYESLRAEGCVPPGQGSTSPEDGITVRIGRDGTLIKCGEGTHRLAIARVLRLATVPVTVDLVHPGWALRCLGKRLPSGRERGSFAPSRSAGP